MKQLGSSWKDNTEVITMTVNEKFISRLISILKNASGLSAHNVRKMEDAGESEYIIRYEDGNNITISIYFSDKRYCSVGYFNAEKRYRNFCTWARIDRVDEAQFLFDIAVKLHRCSDFAIDNCDR